MWYTDAGEHWKDLQYKKYMNVWDALLYILLAHFHACLAITNLN